MTAVTDAMVSAAKQQLPGVWNPARVRKALEAAFALIPEPADPVIPVVASVRVVIDEAAFHRDVAAAVRHLHDGMPHTVDGMIELATLEAELPKATGGLIHPGDIEPLPEWDLCMLTKPPISPWAGGDGPKPVISFTPDPSFANTQGMSHAARKFAAQITDVLAEVRSRRATTDPAPDGLITDATIAALTRNFPEPIDWTNLGSAVEIAARLNVAKSTVRSWIAKRESNGMPMPGEHGYDLDAVVEWYGKWKSDANPTIGANDGGR